MASRESYLNMLPTGIRIPLRKLYDSDASLMAYLTLDRAATYNINITGAFTEALRINADGTTAINVTTEFSGTDMVVLAGSATDNGIEISGACTGAGLAMSGTNGNHLELSGAAATGINMSGAMTNGIVISGTCATTAITISGTMTSANAMVITGGSRIRFYSSTGGRISGPSQGAIQIAAETLSLATASGITVSGNMLMASTGQFQLSASGNYLNYDASALHIVSVASIQLTVAGSGRVLLNGGHVRVQTSNRLEFRDTTAYIVSSAAGKIGINGLGSAADSVAIVSGGGITVIGYMTINQYVELGTTSKLRFTNANNFINFEASNFAITSTASLTLTCAGGGTILLNGGHARVEGGNRLQFRNTDTYLKSISSGKLAIGGMSTGTNSIYMETGPGGQVKIQNGYLCLWITDTDGGREGEIWFDDSEDKIKYYAGGSVRTVPYT